MTKPEKAAVVSRKVETQYGMRVWRGINASFETLVDICDGASDAICFVGSNTDRSDTMQMAARYLIRPDEGCTENYGIQHLLTVLSHKEDVTDREDGLTGDHDPLSMSEEFLNTLGETAVYYLQTAEEVNGKDSRGKITSISYQGCLLELSAMLLKQSKLSDGLREKLLDEYIVNSHGVSSLLRLILDSGIDPYARQRAADEWFVRADITEESEGGPHQFTDTFSDFSKRVPSYGLGSLIGEMSIGSEDRVLLTDIVRDLEQRVPRGLKYAASSDVFKVADHIMPNSWNVKVDFLIRHLTPGYGEGMSFASELSCGVLHISNEAEKECALGARAVIEDFVNDGVIDGDEVKGVIAAIDYVVDKYEREAKKQQAKDKIAAACLKKVGVKRADDWMEGSFI